MIAYRNGFKQIPIPTYILGPGSQKTAALYTNLIDGEICTNLTYLGKRGLYTVTSGLKIAYLSGFEEEKQQGDKSEWTFGKDDVVAVKNSCLVNKATMGDYRGVDILLTTQWPLKVRPDDSSTPDSKPIDTGSGLVSWLAMEIRPRYHFCGNSGEFFERLPYRNPAGNNTQLELATRFLGMAAVNTDKNPKTKFIYALNATPVDKMRMIDLIQKTTTETECPYLNINFALENSTLPTSSDSNAQYFYDMTAGDERHNKRGRRGGGGYHNNDFKRQRQNFDQEKCWFCLSSKDVEKHLIISIGENFYLALAKGPLNSKHVLILSVTHVPATSKLTTDDWAELEKFKTALRAYYASQEQVVVFYERNYKSSHLQINAIPVPKSIEWQIKLTFDDKAEEFNLPFETVPKLTEPTELPEKGPYFLAELPDESTLINKQMKNFPLHYGRDVMCSENLLNCEDKVEWKECLLSREEEIEAVKNFRETYKKFDFTLE